MTEPGEDCLLEMNGMRLRAAIECVLLHARLRARLPWPEDRVGYTGCPESRFRPDQTEMITNYCPVPTFSAPQPVPQGGRSCTTPSITVPDPRRHPILPSTLPIVLPETLQSNLSIRPRTPFSSAKKGPRTATTHPANARSRAAVLKPLAHVSPPCVSPHGDTTIDRTQPRGGSVSSQGTSTWKWWRDSRTGKEDGCRRAESMDSDGVGSTLFAGGGCAGLSWRHCAGGIRD